MLSQSLRSKSTIIKFFTAESLFQTDNELLQWAVESVTGSSEARASARV